MGIDTGQILSCFTESERQLSGLSTDTRGEELLKLNYVKENGKHDCLCEKIKTKKRPSL